VSAWDQRSDALYTRLSTTLSALGPGAEAAYLYVTLLSDAYSGRFAELLAKPYSSPLLVLAMDNRTQAAFDVSSERSSTRRIHSLLLPDGAVQDTVMRAKTEVTLALLEAGWTVVFFEADVFCKADPAALLQHPRVFPPDGSKDFAISAHDPALTNCASELNIGFFIAKPTDDVRNIFCLLANWWHRPNRGWSCAGRTHDQAVWDYAIRRGKEKGKFRHIRIGTNWLRDFDNLNSCQNWPDAKFLRNVQSEKYTGWQRVPIDLIANWPATPDAVCAHVFPIQGPQNRIAGVKKWANQKPNLKG